MEVINSIQNLVSNFLDFFCSIEIFLFILIIIISYQIIMMLIRDKRYINAFNKYKDPEKVSINDLKDIPLVNIIIPAWNETESFRQCLLSITKLKYPKLNVILNIGGSAKTIEIAKSFKKKEDELFKILMQKPGGKIKAINECFSYVSEGILYLIDADVYITDEILLRMLIPLVNYNESVVIGHVKPLKSQNNIDLVKYLQINRNLNFRSKFSRYGFNMISGANTALKYTVMKAIKKFSEDTIYSVEVSQASDILSKGYKIYSLTDDRGKIHSKIPDRKKVWIKQRIRWNENNIVYSYMHKKVNLVKVLVLFIISLYLIIFPFLILIHLGFVLIGTFLLLNNYLIKLRKVLLYKSTTPKDNHFKLGLIFYIKIVFYIYIESLVYVYIIFEMILLGNKKLKKRKNL